MKRRNGPRKNLQTVDATDRIGGETNSGLPGAMPRKSPGSAKPMIWRRPSGSSLYRRGDTFDQAVDGISDFILGETALPSAHNGRAERAARTPRDRPGRVRRKWPTLAYRAMRLTAEIPRKSSSDKRDAASITPCGRETETLLVRVAVDRPPFCARRANMSANRQDSLTQIKVMPRPSMHRASCCFGYFVFYPDRTA